MANSIRLKFLVDLPIKTGASKEALDYDSNKTRYIRISDFDKKGNIREDVKASIENEDGLQYLLNDKDILVAVTGGTVGKSMIFHANGEKCAYAGYLARIKPTASKLNYKYLYYFMNSPCFDIFKANNITISTMENISASKYNNMPVILWDIKKQLQIVEFLDNQITRLDSLSNKINDEIESLNKYKYSIIAECVFNSTKPQKIIYGIKCGFKTYPIGSIFKIKKDIIGHDTDQVLSITQNGIKMKDLVSNFGQLAQSYENYQVVNIGDFAMNHMDLLTGWVDISKYNGVTSPDYRVFVPKDNNICAQYYLYVFQLYYKLKIFYGFGQGVSNLGRWRLPAVNFLKIEIPIPDIETQKEITDYLDKKITLIDKLIAIKKQKLEKIQEYKKTLIYEYITGKKEVV